jgi:hypothetical protein
VREILVILERIKFKSIGTGYFLSKKAMHEILNI